MHELAHSSPLPPCWLHCWKHCHASEHVASARQVLNGSQQCVERQLAHEVVLIEQPSGVTGPHTPFWQRPEQHGPGLVQA